MFSTSVFPRASSVVHPESSQAMAASAAKKARTEAPGSFRKFDLEALKLKAIEGKDSAFYIAVVDGQTAEFVLTPDEPTVVLRGFDMAGDKEKRSFNAHGDEAKGNSLSLYVQLDEEQVKFLDAASEKLKAQFEGDVVWSPLVPKNDKYQSHAIGVDICLGGKDTALTPIKIKQGGETLAGAGWDFLKERASGSYTAFTGAEVMMVVKFRPWKAVVQGVTKAGVKLVATQLAIKVLERKFVDVLPDW